MVHDIDNMSLKTYNQEYKVIPMSNSVVKYLYQGNYVMLLMSNNFGDYLNPLVYITSIRSPRIGAWESGIFGLKCATGHTGGGEAIICQSVHQIVAAGIS
jgi:hypothetical protein